MQVSRWADGTIETIASNRGFSTWGPPVGGVWGDDGTIVIGFSYGLFEVAATGGEPESLARVDAQPGESVRYGRPDVLPGTGARVTTGLMRRGRHWA